MSKSEEIREEQKLNGVLTTSQVARQLNITPYSVRRMLRDGLLKGFKVGSYAKKRHWRVRQQDLETFTNSNINQASAESIHTEASK